MHFHPKGCLFIRLLQMNTDRENNGVNVLYIQDSDLYKEFLAEREEIMMHKWLESEKVGYDIGFERALMDWRVKHRSKWIESRMKERNLTRTSNQQMASTSE